MNEDINSSPASENALKGNGDGLAGAFNELIQSRLDGKPGSGRRQPESAPSEDAAGPCPEPGDWALLLGDEAGTTEAAKVNGLLAHAVVCDVCAERLRALAGDASPEENAVFAGLKYSSPEEQRKLAAELAGTPVHSSSVQFRSRRLQSISGWPSRMVLWMGAGLAASLLIAVGLFSWWRMANNPENLLAEAYTHDRIFDRRMPGAGFAEVTPKMHLRGGATGNGTGGNGSGGRESAKLVDARARIERQLEAAPENEHWLQLEARSDILEEKFDQAIDILDRLIAAGPVSPSLLLDDASAYFDRGEATETENDRATALDMLRRADELAPGDPVVLFNEAVAMEDRGQLMNAVETWNRYLRFERDPHWLAEGRRRLETLEQKLNQLKTRESQPPAN
jgi:tetratricopeptide (TPR) repeat protein